MCNVLVSNGCAEAEVVEELAPLMDAANIDLKGPSQEFYDWTGGSFAAVCRTIEMLHRAGCHVEATTLVIPGRNDSDESIDAIAERIASVSPEIPLHVTRFFPRFQMADADPTPVATIHRLVSRARRILPHVLPGNC
jgi:pyruvate formate lyase activating enzyme